MPADLIIFLILPNLGLKDYDYRLSFIPPNLSPIFLSLSMIIP